METNKKCLVTTGLIGAIDWFCTAPSIVIKPERGGDGKTTWKEKAQKDLIALLSREPGEFPESARRGVEFEKRVYKYANIPKEIPAFYSDKFRRVCKEVEGFQFYKKGGLVIEIDGEFCYLYGKYDAINLPKIKDIKTTEEYKLDKYLKGIQHKIYCLISGAEEFEYIIAEWDKYPKIKQIYKESYKVENREKLQIEIVKKIKECFDIIKELNLWEIYKTKFCLY